MDQGIVMIDKMMKSFLKHAFIRNGSVTLTNDENGEVSNIVLASNGGCGLANTVCPYCGGTNNVHELNNTGFAIKAEEPNKETDELEINGFRCVACAQSWLMLVSDKGHGFSLGLKATRAS